MVHRFFFVFIIFPIGGGALSLRHFIVMWDVISIFSNIDLVSEKYDLFNISNSVLKITATTANPIWSEMDYEIWHWLLVLKSVAIQAVGLSGNAVSGHYFCHFLFSSLFTFFTERVLEWIKKLILWKFKGVPKIISCCSLEIINEFCIICPPHQFFVENQIMKGDKSWTSWGWAVQSLDQLGLVTSLLLCG